MVESPIAVAEQDSYGIDKIIGFTRDRQVELAIAIEVAHRQRVDPSKPGREDLGGLKGAVAVAQEYAHLATPVHAHDVELAVVVEVSHHQKASRCTGAVTLGRLEGAVPVAQQDRYAAVGIVGSVPAVVHGEIGDAVAVEVAHGYRSRLRARGVDGRGDKTACHGLPDKNHSKDGRATKQRPRKESRAKQSPERTHPPADTHPCRSDLHGSTTAMDGTGVYGQSAALSRMITPPA